VLAVVVGSVVTALTANLLKQFSHRDIAAIEAADAENQ